MEEKTLVPKAKEDFFEFGAFEDVKKIVESGHFIPTFITGLSRSGKTCMVEQIAAVLKKELVRVNFTEETDEDDLIGGHRMQDGNTYWFYGPVVQAMQKGAILLLDEVDKASHKCMCLQPVLEGSPVYIKQTAELIYPAKGFNIIATANTKGQGDVRGKFLSSQRLDEAFLDRFSITVEHNYPPPDVETKILTSYINGNRITAIDEKFVEYLIEWAGIIRTSYEGDSISDLISTGRLIHIMKVYKVFKDPFKAIRYGIARFDESTKEVFWDIFSKKFPYDEGDIAPTGAINSKRFIKRVAEDMDLSEFNTRYKVPAAKNP